MKRRRPANPAARALHLAATFLAQAAKALDAELASRPARIPEPPPVKPLTACDVCAKLYPEGSALTTHKRMAHGTGLMNAMTLASVNAERAAADVERPAASCAGVVLGPSKRTRKGGAA